jgi:DNA polymerase-3 subunit gamma/tau
LPEQALYLKWRPTAFDEVVGQEHIIRTLKNSLKTGRIRHAYLFSGPRGTGKTTNARLLAKAVNCLNDDPDKRPCNACSNCIAINEGRFLDLIEIDAASHTGVDDVRDLRDKIAFSPTEGRYKVYIIDEVHRFSGNAFDALLKTLEEPPDHALFVLATTEIDKVPATIKSRCLPFEFRRLTVREVTDRLQQIADAEGIRIERSALELIAREGTGSVRDSVSLLDQVVADPAEEITLELAQRILGTASARAVRELVEALVGRQMAHGLHILNEAIDNGSDPRQFGQQVVEQLRLVLLAQTAGPDMLHVSEDEQQYYQRLAGQIGRTDLMRAVRAFNEAVTQYSVGWQPQLPLELALIESLQPVEVVHVVEQGLPAVPAAPTVAAPGPGKPGVVSAQFIAQKWSEAQRLIHNNIANARPDQRQAVVNLPSLMQQVHVRGVDGNTVLLGAKDIYRNILNHQTRLEWIERALYRVTGVELKVKIVQDDGSPSDTLYMTPSPEMAENPVVQVLMEEGGVLLSEEILEEDEPGNEEM